MRPKEYFDEISLFLYTTLFTQEVTKFVNMSGNTHLTDNSVCFLVERTQTELDRVDSLLLICITPIEILILLPYVETLIYKIPFANVHNYYLKDRTLILRWKDSLTPKLQSLSCVTYQIPEIKYYFDKIFLEEFYKKFSIALHKEEFTINIELIANQVLDSTLEKSPQYSLTSSDLAPSIVDTVLQFLNIPENEMPELYKIITNTIDNRLVAIKKTKEKK